MKAPKYTLAIAVGLVTLVATNVAHADDIVLVTISGLTYNNTAASGINCSSPCSETENASFKWDNATNTYVSGSATGSLAGNLLPLSSVGSPFVRNLGGQVVEFDLFDTAGFTDNYDLLLYDNNNVLAPGAYTVVNATGGVVGPFQAPANLSCGSGFTCSFGSDDAFPIAGTVTVTSIAAPEPSPFLLLATGLLGLAGMTWRKSRFA